MKEFYSEIEKIIKDKFPGRTFFLVGYDKDSNQIEFKQFGEEISVLEKSGIMSLLNQQMLRGWDPERWE